MKWRKAEDRADHWRSMILNDPDQVRRVTEWLDKEIDVVAMECVEQLEVQQRTRERYRKR